MGDIIFNRFPVNLANKEVNFETDTIKCALLKDSYTPDKDHNQWSDVSADEVSGSGYTTGGTALNGCSVTQDNANDLCKLDADDVVFSSVSLTGDNAPRYAVIYDDTLANKDLICVFDFGSALEANGDLTIKFDANGLVNIEQGA
jgi:hypothetical protein